MLFCKKEINEAIDIPEDQSAINLDLINSLTEKVEGNTNQIQDLKDELQDVKDGIQAKNIQPKFFTTDKNGLFHSAVLFFVLFFIVSGWSHWFF